MLPSRCDYDLGHGSMEGASSLWAGLPDKQQIKAVAGPRNQLQTPYAGVVQTGPYCPGRPTGAIPSRAPLSSLNVIHQRQFVAGGERAHFGEGAAVEDARNRVASGDHDDPDRAGLEVARNRRKVGTP